MRIFQITVKFAGIVVEMALAKVSPTGDFGFGLGGARDKPTREGGGFCLAVT
jgi:hypothetical protein